MHVDYKNSFKHKQLCPYDAPSIVCHFRDRSKNKSGLCPHTIYIWRDDIIIRVIDKMIHCLRT